MNLKRTVFISLFLSVAFLAHAEEAPIFRPPAVPLVTHDPYFSIWSMGDRLSDDWSKHWTGRAHALAGMVRIDGMPFRLMGPEPRQVPALNQTRCQVFPTRSVYTFAGAGLELTLEFLSPLLADDLDILSRPATYLTLEARALDGREHRLAWYVDACSEIAINSPDQKVIGARYDLEGMEVLAFGSQQQPVLEKTGDDLRIDWGYFYLATPRARGIRTRLADSRESRQAFARSGDLPPADDLRFPRRVEDGFPVAAARLDLDAVGENPVSRHLILAYDDQFSIEYLYRRLQPFWRRTGWGASDLLQAAARDYETLRARCRAFDQELVADLARAGGEKYARLASLAYRQTLAAHKLVADIDGTPLLFPKENFSNGCISTVDVIYPASPFALLFNARLLRGLLTPVLEYSRSGRWPFPFAPHDLGTYPQANGQVYGGGPRSEEDQMPVEESGNMLILLAALARVEGSADFARAYWPQVQLWARYLLAKGFDPENQLCTDDFAGHLAHNANLSIKAIVALRAYADLCQRLGNRSEARLYQKRSGEFALNWTKQAADGDHFRLAFDRPGTWSQKYNLVWDRLLGYHLFPAAVVQKEIDFYKTKQLPFGLPLDSRKTWTKLDWILWTATLCPKPEDFRAFIAPVYDFLNRTPDRVPLTDWYWADSGRQVGFQARPVIGGVFIKMLADPELWQKWSQKPLLKKGK